MPNTPLHHVVIIGGGFGGLYAAKALRGAPVRVTLVDRRNFHIPSDLVVECGTAHRKPPEVRICRLRNQSAVGTRPPSTSTPHCPACWARR